MGCVYVRSDGDEELVVHFEGETGLESGDYTVKLVGETDDGVPIVSEDNITDPIAVFAKRDIDGMAGTQDVADAVGCSYDTAYKKLQPLEDAGSMESDKVANARVWLRADK